MAIKINRLDMDGSVLGELEINDTFLETKKGTQAVHDTVVAFRAGIRAGTACTKTRAEVRGGGRKPFRQKGTGRARAGSTRSPIWRGGGVVFGPKPRSYAKKVNKKIRTLALRRAFSDKLTAGDIIFVDTISIAEPKTKLVNQFLQKVGAGRKALVLVNDYDVNLLLASRNLSGINVMASNTVNVYQMLLYKKIVITDKAFEVLKKRLKGEKIDEKESV